MPVICPPRFPDEPVPGCPGEPCAALAAGAPPRLVSNEETSFAPTVDHYLRLRRTPLILLGSSARFTGPLAQALDAELTLPALASHGEAMPPLPALASHGEAMPLAVRSRSQSRPLVRMPPLLETCAAVAPLSCALAPTGWQAALRLTWARQECATALPSLSSRLGVGALPDLDPPLPSLDRPRRLTPHDGGPHCRLSSTPPGPGARRASPGS